MKRISRFTKVLATTLVLCMFAMLTACLGEWTTVGASSSDTQGSNSSSENASSPVSVPNLSNPQSSSSKTDDSGEEQLTSLPPITSEDVSQSDTEKDELFLEYAAFIATQITSDVEDPNDILGLPNFTWLLLNTSYRYYHESSEVSEYEDEFEYLHMKLSLGNVQFVASSFFQVDDITENFLAENGYEADDNGIIDFTYIGEEAGNAEIQDYEYKDNQYVVYAKINIAEIGSAEPNYVQRKYVYHVTDANIKPIYTLQQVMMS